ncbi:hypothetical protein [Arthrobacter sp. ok362]|jgi:hypothetical protein|uniref:hypothetical protein n=1 Tax=Arthrobacter sp. ok362 TaxID=1761745 RepID=UPI001113446C|nr:hypothetical protein [Arthrobacter sp. ok362]
MEHLRGPLYLDIAAKGLSLTGVVMMVFGQDGWFTAGLFTVFIGVLIGAWAMVAVRRVRSPNGPSRPAPFGAWRRRDGATKEDRNS